MHSRLIPGLHTAQQLTDGFSRNLILVSICREVRLILAMIVPVNRGFGYFAYPPPAKAQRLPTVSLRDDRQGEDVLHGMMLPIKSTPEQAQMQ